MMRSYAADVVNISNVKAMSVNPGPLRTRMRAAAMPGEDPTTLKTPEEFAPKLADLCGAGLEGNGKDL